MRQVFQWILIMGSVFTGIYKFRYRILDYMTKVPVIKKSFVRMTMNIPWIRRKFLSNMFQKA